MLYPLEAPNGWFLLKMEHQHSQVRYVGDTHEPLPHLKGPWYVEFQKYPKGGLMVSGRGHTMEQAWEDATNNVLIREMGD